MKPQDKSIANLADAVSRVLLGEGKATKETKVQDSDKDFVDLHSIDKHKRSGSTALEEKDIEEANEFTKAAAKAAVAGDDEFEFEGKKFPTEMDVEVAKKILGESTSIEEAIRPNDKVLGKTKNRDGDEVNYFVHGSSFKATVAFRKAIKKLLSKPAQKKFDVYIDGNTSVVDADSSKTIVDFNDKMTISDVAKAVEAFIKKEYLKEALNKFKKEDIDLSEASPDKKALAKDLENLINNPDPSRVKQYGGTKYVDMLKSKLAKLQEEDIDEAINYILEDETTNIEEMSDEELDEMLEGILGKIGSAIKSRVTISGRADRAGKKADKIDKKAADRERLKKAKERIKKAKEAKRKKRESADEAVEVNGGALAEAAKMSSGVKQAQEKIYSLERSLKVGSNLNKGVNKTLDGKYDGDFKIMEKAVSQILTVWQDIEYDYGNMNEAVVSLDRKALARQKALFKWEDVNSALDGAGVNPAGIKKVHSALRGKEQ